MSTPRAPVELAYLPFTAGDDALRISSEVGDRLFDAIDRTAAVAHQPFHLAQALVREAGEPLRDHPETRVQRVGHLFEGLQRLAGLDGETLRIVGTEQRIDLHENAVDPRRGLVEAVGKFVRIGNDLVDVAGTLAESGRDLGNVRDDLL